MNQKERITFQVFVINEFLYQVLKVAQSRLAEKQEQRLSHFLNKLLGDGNEVFQQVEHLAQIQDTTEITIFFSDLLERLDFEDPFDLMSSFQNLIDDFVTLIELLFEEQEYINAIDEYIEEAGIVEDAAAEDAAAEDAAARYDSDFTEELVEDEATDTLVKEEKIDVPEIPVLSIDETDPDKEYKLTEFIFAEIIKKVDSLPVAAKDDELKSSLKQYVTQMKENFRRNPKLLVNQPHEVAKEIANEILDNLQEPDEKLFNNYAAFIERVVSLLNTYAEENKDDLLKSFTGVLPEMVAEKDDDSDVKERKVLQKRIYSYFEKETDYHLDEIEKSISAESGDSFWVELEALRTLVMIHGYEAIETACLRLQREKTQWSSKEIDTFLAENSKSIVSGLRAILTNEIDKDIETAQAELDKLDDLIFSGFEKFDSIELNENLKIELKEIWFNKFKDRDLIDLKEWIKIDLDNVTIFDYDQDFIEGLSVIDSFLDKNPFIKENWGEFYSDWPVIFKKADADLLTERVNAAFEISTGAVLDFSDQETLTIELFGQIRKRFKDLAPYYQLTDDEQAYFQQQVVELSVFITNENYKNYVNKLIENLNEFFFEEISEKFVRKYFSRISAAYEDLVFPLEDFAISGEVVPETDTQAEDKKDADDWIDEVEAAVSEEDQEEFLGVFKTESEASITELKDKVNNIKTADADLLTEIENLYHSINTSAGFVGLKNTSLLSGELEKTIEELKKSGLENLQSVPLKAFTDSIKLIEQVIEDPSEDEKLNIDGILKKIQSWQEDWKVTAESSAEKEAESMADDPELLEVFQTEASENVNLILDNLQTLRKSPTDPEAIKIIETSSHNITTAAKMLGFSNIGDLTVKLETYSESKLAKNEAFLEHHIDLYEESIKSIEAVMSGKISESQLKDLVTSFDDRIELQAVEEIDLGTYINQFMHKDINAFIENDKTEIQIREYITEISKLAENTVSGKLVEDLINTPFEEWPEKTTKIAPPSYVTAVTGSSKIAVEKTDILLDSSAALVDSQLDMQDQLNRNKELLTELNSTQNLLNYLKAELDELNQKEKKSKEVKKRQKELSRILDDAVAKMTHLVQEMGRVNTAFESRLTEFDNISDSFQRNILEARKMPASDLMLRIDDYVEEIRAKSGKKFNIIFSGEDIELDKSTVDFLEASFKELLTNSVFHGIETPEERKNAGKDETGKIEINLSKNRNLINLEFNDDGNGLDLGRVAEMAEKKGMGKIENDEELVDLLFSEEFSYSDDVNDYVGDGNGLAELKKAIEIILGDISIDSEKGKHTKISLMFPQHLKIAEAAIVQAENDHFAIPLGPDDESLTLKKSDIEETNGSLWITYKKKKHPVFLLNSVLNMESKGQIGNKVEAMRFNLGNKFLFLIVDSIKEIDTIVIRPLQKEIKNLTFIAGVAQLPNFQTVLVLETDILIKEISAGADFEYRDVKNEPGKKEKHKDKPLFTHAVVLDSSTISTEIVAGVLRDNKIETEVITDVSEWNEDHDRADILFVDNYSYEELKKRKGLWLDSPQKIIVLHEGDLKKVPSGADQILGKPFTANDVSEAVKIS